MRYEIWAFVVHVCCVLPVLTLVMQAALALVEARRSGTRVQSNLLPDPSWLTLEDGYDVQVTASLSAKLVVTLRLGRPLSWS